MSAPRNETPSASPAERPGASSAVGRPRTTQRSAGEPVRSAPTSVPPRKSTAAIRLSQPSLPVPADEPGLAAGPGHSPSAVGAAQVTGPTGTVPTPVAPPAPPADRWATRLLAVLAVSAVLLVAAAVLLGVAWGAERHSGPRANQAFIDGGATAALVGEVTSAVIAVYSYDYTTLPANEAAAKAVVTGRYAGEFDKLFASLKQVAVAEQASMRTTVPAAAVSLLQGDRARLLMMVDQAGVRGTDRQPTGASARLVIDAQRIEGHWKIAEVTPE